MRHSLPEAPPSVEGRVVSVTESVPARVGPPFLELPFLLAFLSAFPGVSEWRFLPFLAPFLWAFVWRFYCRF
ncbi:hypothetical protein LCGC14_3097030 [marine sediment metagenome]|uniref:Uncharacterized protein n=1 Tax=marine sediment metagenome TaxID=412755 RepID=A0A0F8W8R8_9ZZZZ